MFLKLNKKSCLTLIFFSFFASSSHGSSALEEVEPSVTLLGPSHTPTSEQISSSVDVFKGHAKVSIQVFSPDKKCPEISDTNAVWDAFCSLLGGDHPLSIVWAIRGGRMSLRFWEKLDDAVEADSTFLERLQSKIVLVGFSDITSLHLWFNAHGIPSLHGPVAAFCEETRVGCGTNTSIIRDVWPVVTGEKPSLTYTGILPVNHAAKSTEVIETVLIGGNLSSLDYWNGVYGPFPVGTTKRALLIETTGEDPTRALSILTALKRGFFASGSVSAILFGDLHGISPASGEFTTKEERFSLLINSFATSVSIPVFRTGAGEKLQDSDLRFGHGDYNDPIPLGTPARFMKSSDTSFSLEINGFKK